MIAAAPIIGRKIRYVGPWHGKTKGSIGTIVAIHRDGEILEDDRVIGSLRSDDIVEWKPEIHEKGETRQSFVSYDALPEHLETVV